MTKFALIGKNIQHSRSPEVYKNLLGHEVDYTLLDYQSESEIAPLSELLKKFPRISITAPYKQYVLEHSDVASVEAQDLKAANAIKLESGKVVATNTDAQAFAEIFEQRWPGSFPIILGDGAMSRLAQQYFKNKNIAHIILSRKLGNLKDLDTFINQSTGKILIINSCSREYEISFESSKSLEIWDLNYSMDNHKNFAKRKGIPYTDGQELLIRQAQYALSFWNS